MKSPDEEESKIKRTELTFEDSTSESPYYTTHFKIKGATIEKATGPFYFPSEIRSVLLQVIESSFDKVVSASKVDDARGHLNVVSRLLVKYLSFGDASLLFKHENDNLRGPVEMLNALLGSKVIDQTEVDKNIDASVTNLCIAISRSIELKTKLALYDGLFHQQKDRKLADRVLESLLHAEIDETPEKKSVISSTGFSMRIQQIAENFGSSKTADVDKESLNLVAIAVQNYNFITSNLKNFEANSISYKSILFQLKLLTTYFSKWQNT
jgi:hypothetical protein